MILDTYTQQPTDRLDYDIDYTEFLPGTDEIDAAKVVLAVDRPGLTVFATVTGPILKVWVEGGTNKTTYKITVSIETHDGRKKQDEFIVKIKDF